MAEYHVGCGIFEIYAGTLNKNKNKNKWINKSIVTDECISSSAQYLLEHNKSMTFNYKDKKYKISVSEVE